jgi:hypothetical protein
MTSPSPVPGALATNCPLEAVRFVPAIAVARSAIDSIRVALPSASRNGMLSAATLITAPVRLLNARVAALPELVTSPVKFALVVTLPAVRPEAVPVTLVMTPDAGVPRAGVTNVGDVANTADPVPVSLVSAVSNCNDVKDPKTAAFPTDVT